MVKVKASVRRCPSFKVPAAQANRVASAVAKAMAGQGATPSTSRRSKPVKPGQIELNHFWG